MADPRPLPFDWADPFALDDQLSDEERMVRDTAENFAQAKLLPRVNRLAAEAGATSRDARCCRINRRPQGGSCIPVHQLPDRPRCWSSGTWSSQ